MYTYTEKICLMLTFDLSREYEKLRKSNLHSPNKQSNLDRLIKDWFGHKLFTKQNTQLLLSQNLETSHDTL